jgi:DNA-binding LytR/AlgR family response regulator
MHILIADDEKPARAELRYMLQQLEADAIYSEARNGQEVLTLVAQQPVDVLFLDINMPGINGLSVATALLENPNPPLIIFATAYDAHAVRAFELAALDYIVKPFAEQRLAQTMQRIRKTLAEQEQLAQKQRALRTYLQGATGAPALAKLWAERANGTGVLLDYREILWIEAEEKKVYVQPVTGERLTLTYTLKELEERLTGHPILRVHKAYLVNLDHVLEVAPMFSGTFLLRMNDAPRTEIPMSRQYAKTLKALMG